MKKYKLLIYLFILFFVNNYSYGELKIEYKVGEEIITNYDILNERDYLIFLRPNLKELSQEDILKLSKNSLIRQIIKKKELDRIFKNLDDVNLNKEMKLKLMKFKSVDHDEKLKTLIKSNNLDYDSLLKRLKYESLWNELIYKKFSALIKIDRNKLRNDLTKKISNIKKYEYNLSELLFEIEDGETLNSKYEKIIKLINLKGFKNASYNFSISNSSKKGGEIGWVKETLLSDKLNKILVRMKQGQITKPIKYPNGYLLIKINDKKDLKEKINIENELKELIQYESGRQLNQYSLLFYKKLKQNTIINEY